MSSEVYFANARCSMGRGLLDKTKTLFDRIGFEEIIKKNNFVAIKLHFGELGNTAFLRPIYVRKIVGEVKKLGGKPFLTDANTLYWGTRWNAVDHIKTAILNGFDYSVVDAPIIIADGLTGRDYVKVKIEGKHFKEVKIASAVHRADVLISLAHFKGHMGAGFGGAIKNVGMGLGCRSGKQMMHSGLLPEINKQTCAGCKDCLEICPTKAIEIIDDKASIIKKRCIGCAECTVVCTNQAIAINWSEDAAAFQEKMVEYLWGAVLNKKGKTAYFNFLTDISPDCDCNKYSDKPFVPDLGILSSKDPIAIDQASVNLVNEAKGVENSRLDKKNLCSNNKFRSLYPGIDWRVQLEYGEKIGLGERDFKLISID